MITKFYDKAQMEKGWPLELTTVDKVKKLNKFILTSEPAQKCGNNALFKQNYSLAALNAL